MSYRKHPPDPPSARFWLGVVAIAIGTFLLIAAVRATAAPRSFDCGPEGMPVPGQNACIDREPAYTEWPE